MTVDELCELVEALTADVTIPDLMAGLNSDVLVKLTPEQFVLLVRFLGGERPVTMSAVERSVSSLTVLSAGDGYPKTYVGPAAEEQGPTHVNEPARNVLVERGPNGQAILGGEFAGIELP